MPGEKRRFVCEGLRGLDGWAPSWVDDPPLEARLQRLEEAHVAMQQRVSRLEAAASHRSRLEALSARLERLERGELLARVSAMEQALPAVMEPCVSVNEDEKKEESEPLDHAILRATKEAVSVDKPSTTLVYNFMRTPSNPFSNAKRRPAAQTAQPGRPVVDQNQALPPNDGTITGRTAITTHPVMPSSTSPFVEAGTAARGRSLSPIVGADVQNHQVVDQPVVDTRGSSDPSTSGTQRARRLTRQNSQNASKSRQIVQPKTKVRAIDYASHNNLAAPSAQIPVSTDSAFQYTRAGFPTRQIVQPQIPGSNLQTMHCHQQLMAQQYLRSQQQQLQMNLLQRMQLQAQQQRQQQLLQQQLLLGQQQLTPQQLMALQFQDQQRQMLQHRLNLQQWLVQRQLLHSMQISPAQQLAQQQLLPQAQQLLPMPPQSMQVGFQPQTQIPQSTYQQMATAAVPVCQLTPHSAPAMRSTPVRAVSLLPPNGIEDSPPPAELNLTRTYSAPCCLDSPSTYEIFPPRPRRRNISLDASISLSSQALSVASSQYKLSCQQPSCRSIKSFFETSQEMQPAVIQHQASRSNHILVQGKVQQPSTNEEINVAISFPTDDILESGHFEVTEETCEFVGTLAVDVESSPETGRRVQVEMDISTKPDGVNKHSWRKKLVDESPPEKAPGQKEHKEQESDFKTTDEEDDGDESEEMPDISSQEQVTNSNVPQVVQSLDSVVQEDEVPPSAITPEQKEDQEQESDFEKTDEEDDDGDESEEMPDISSQKQVTNSNVPQVVQSLDSVVQEDEGGMSQDEEAYNATATESTSPSHIGKKAKSGEVPPSAITPEQKEDEQKSDFEKASEEGDDESEEMSVITFEDQVIDGNVLQEEQSFDSVVQEVEGETSQDEQAVNAIATEDIPPFPTDKKAKPGDLSKEDISSVIVTQEEKSATEVVQTKESFSAKPPSEEEASDISISEPDEDTVEIQTEGSESNNHIKDESLVKTTTTEQVAGKEQTGKLVSITSVEEVTSISNTPEQAVEYIQKRKPVSTISIDNVSSNTISREPKESIEIIHKEEPVISDDDVKEEKMREEDETVNENETTDETNNIDNHNTIVEAEKDEEQEEGEEDKTVDEVAAVGDSQTIDKSKDVDKGDSIDDAEKEEKEVGDEGETVDVGATVNPETVGKGKTVVEGETSEEGKTGEDSDNEGEASEEATKHVSQETMSNKTPPESLPQIPVADALVPKAAPGKHDVEEKNRHRTRPSKSGKDQDFKQVLAIPLGGTTPSLATEAMRGVTDTWGVVPKKHTSLQEKELLAKMRQADEAMQTPAGTMPLGIGNIPLAPLPKGVGPGVGGCQPAATCSNFRATDAAMAALPAAAAAVLGWPYVAIGAQPRTRDSTKPKKTTKEKLRKRTHTCNFTREMKTDIKMPLNSSVAMNLKSRPPCCRASPVAPSKWRSSSVTVHASPGSPLATVCQHGSPGRGATPAAFRPGRSSANHAHDPAPSHGAGGGHRSRSRKRSGS